MKRTLIFLAQAAILGAIAGCEKGSAQAQAPASMAASVTVAPAVAKDVPIYIDEIGKTISVESVTIIPQVGGKVIAQHVEDGATVKKGQLLFEIDPRPYEAALASAKAQLIQNKADLELAQTEYKRIEGLVNTSAVSQLEYDQKKSAVAVDEGKVAWAEAELQQSALNLEYTKIVSPIDGRAGARLVDAGNVVKANEGPMLVIQRLDPIYAEFTITENDLGTVRKFLAAKGMDLGPTPEKGLKVLVDLPANSQKVTSVLGAPTPSTQPGKNHAGPRVGTLTFLDNTVQASTGTVRLRATLSNPDNYFWPGQFVNTRMVLTTKKDAVLIPAQAQQIGQQGPFVYVVKDGEVENPDKTKTKAKVAELRPITPGQRQGDMIVVDSGLNAGEDVIVTGQMMVMPGGAVNVVNATPSASAKAAVSSAN